MPASLAQAVTVTVNALELLPVDTGLAALASKYAEQIDNAGEIAELGHRLLATLEALGATPAARSKATRPRPVAGSPSASKLDQLRARRAGR